MSKHRSAWRSTLALAVATSLSSPLPVQARPWFLQKPNASTQKEKSSDERGVNPCNTPDPGFGVYGPWDRGVSMGQAIVPVKGGLTKAGEFDAMIHFHGHEPVRKEWVQAMDGAVLVGIDLGNGSGPYESTFEDKSAFTRLLTSIEETVALHAKRKRAKLRRLGLSAWSAGYGAIQRILEHAALRDRVDIVILLDGLHCGYAQDSLNDMQLGPFIEFARMAAAGKKLMFVSHSSIIPPGYASTTETANFLVDRVGGRAARARPRAGDPMGLELISQFSRGGFHVRGFSGNGKLDHCAHLGLLRDVLRVHVKPRWKSPRGSR
jgi:hypothetical protein